MSTDADAAGPANHHDDETLFANGKGEGWKPIGKPLRLIDDADESGITIAATATDQGTIALATMITKDDAGNDCTPAQTTLQLDPGTLLRLAAMVPPELFAPHAGAEVIQLHPGRAMRDVVVRQNGVTSAPCQAVGCERRIERVGDDGDWNHLPDPFGNVPEHPPVPPQDLA